ncbi:hypothetical protein ONJ95_25490, partial [Salmonella enterica subsp. enterica serovar Virginia]|nr:hypothetical protein [Salmonella enterica subsp. enterica serovar Virginia]
EFHLDNPSDYFLNYCRRYTDMPMLVLLDERADGSYVSGRMMRVDLWHGGDFYEVTPDNEIVWHYEDIYHHHDAQWLANGNLLYTA